MYQTEPASIGGVLDAGVRLFRTSFKAVIVTAATGFGVLFGFDVLFELAFGISNASINTGAAGAELTEADLATIAYAPVYLVLWATTTGAVVLHLDRIGDGQADAGVGVFGASLRRLPAYIGMMLLYVLAVTVGMVLLVAPGIWLATALGLGYYLVFSEGLGPIAALKCSMELVKDNWWRTATVFLVAFVMVMVVQAGIITLPAGVAGYQAASGEEVGTGWILTLNLLSAIAMSVTTPLLASFGLSMIRDLQLRKSGADLEARLDIAGA